MKKIGLITFHKYHNYGAVLQAYATQKFINSRCDGSFCEIIDYYEPQLIDVGAFTPHRLYGSLETEDEYSRERVLNYESIQQRKRNFKEFQDRYYILSRPYETREELLNNPPQYDIYMTGSDQVWNWNREYTPYRLLPYLLWFTHSTNKIAFGCGMSSDEKCDIYVPFRYKPAIRAYKKYLLREYAAVEKIEKVSGRTDVECVLDPVFLLDAKDYAEIARAEVGNEPYIFAYLFDYDRQLFEQIMNTLVEMSSQEKKKVFLITNTVPINSENIETIVNAGPLEWLGYLLKADRIVTNSFHGLAVAIIMGKEVYSYGTDSRKEALLQLLGDFERSEELVKISFDIEIKRRVKEMQERTRKLLIDAIQECY